MRVFLAGLFVFSGLLFAVCLLGPPLNHRPLGIIVLMSVGLGLAAVTLAVVALFLFNSATDKHKETGNSDQYIQDLVDNGLLVSTDYQANRAFQLEEYEDEGSQYFIELTDGGVLYLAGQYLYFYEPVDDDPGLKQPRRFPCTEFSIRSHRDEKFKVDIVCQGSAIKPEYIKPHPEVSFWKRELEDGQIITDLSYDKIRAQLVNKVGKA